MDELPIKLKELLRDAQLAHEPPPGARERVQLRLAAAVSCEGLRPLQRGAVPSTTEAWTRLGLAAVLLTLLGISRIWLPEEIPPESPRLARSFASPASQVEREPTPRSLPESLEADSETTKATPVTSDSPPRRTSRGTRRARAAHDADETLIAELNLLKQASDALATRDFARADSLLDLYRTRFANGQLIVERDGLEVVRHCLAGASDASLRAQTYLQAIPHAVLAQRIESACSGMR